MRAALGGLGALAGGVLLAAQVLLHGLQHGVARDDVGDLVELVRGLQHRLQVVLEPGLGKRVHSKSQPVPFEQKSNT